MKVLMLNEIMDWGGGEVLTLDLVLALSKNGVKLTLGCNPGSVLGERAKEEGIRVIPIRMRNEIDILAVIFLVATIQKEKFEIIHCHTMRDHVLGSLAARYLGTLPVVRTQHIHYPENPSLMAQLAYKKWTDKIICNSEFIRKNLLDVGIDSSLLTMVHNGINLDRMKYFGKPKQFKAEIGFINEETLVGCIGSLFQTKGQEYLIKAFPGILQNHSHCRLVIVGDGPERGKLETLVDELNIRKEVVFTGKRKDIPDILASLDLMVVPSVWDEPFGLVSLEAMSMRVPLIVTSVGGIPEVVENNITGITVQPGDCEALMKAVVRIIDDRELTSKIVDNAEKRVREYFNAHRMASQVEVIYGQLVKP